MPERFDYAERFVTGCMENPEFRVGELVPHDAAKKEAERIWDELLKMEVGCFATLKAHDVSFTRLAYQIAYLKLAYFSELMFAREECRTAAAERKVVGELTLDKIKDAIGEGMQTWPHYLDAAVIMDDGYGSREYGWLRNATLKKGAESEFQNSISSREPRTRATRSQDRCLIP